MATVSMSKSYFVMLIILSVMGLFKISSIVNEALITTTTSRTYTPIHNYNGTSLKTLISSESLKKMTEAYTTYSKKESSSCPEGLVFFQDKIMESKNENTNSTNSSSRIPNIIHFFAKSKCLPKQVYENLQTWVDTISDYSIILHDWQEISKHLSKPRKDLPFVVNAFQCAFTHEAILDLARFIFLYDYGGISTDINQLPAPGFVHFANGNMRSTQDEYYIELENDETFIAAIPRHLNVYIHLQLSIANQYQQFAFNSTSDFWYHGARNSIYSLPLQSDYVEDVTGNMDMNSPLVEKKQLQGFNPSTVIYSSRISQGFLTSKTITEEGKRYIEFGNVLDTNGRDEEIKQCVDFTNDSFHVDLQDLIQVAGGVDTNLNATCPNNNMTYQGNFFTDDVYKGTRKIPKILHMTSKNKCFTKAFAENIKQWTQPGYSFVLHDDEAVDRLFHNYEWNEFPLLKHVLTCLTGGAMKADLWRYLALWKWGGVYTDVDNAPGREWFKEGTFIDDNMDAVFEVERGGYPSQYFYAISPRHPASYFMVSTAIARILFNDKPMKRMGMIPWLTGPGTLKNALILSFGGNGYPPAGTYIGKSNRSMTILGSSKDAKQSKYVGRCIIRNANKEDEAAMDMPHYSKAKSKQGRPNYTCRVQIMKDSKSFLAGIQ